MYNSSIARNICTFICIMQNATCGKRIHERKAVQLCTNNVDIHDIIQFLFSVQHKRLVSSGTILFPRLITDRGSNICRKLVIYLSALCSMYIFQMWGCRNLINVTDNARKTLFYMSFIIGERRASSQSNLDFTCIVGYNNVSPSCWFG